jgi:uncharacterized coiled-coil protein SlyX
MFNKLTALCFVFVLSFASCTDYKPEVDRLNRERDSLINVGTKKDSTIDSFLGDFNAIESSLDSINQIHAAITLDRKRDPEMGGTVKDRIKRNMESINQLLDQNSQRIAELTRKLNGSNVKSKQLEKMIASLNMKIAERDSMIAGLNNQLGDARIEITGLRTNVETLNATIADKERVIEERTNTLNTAYYIVGTFKQLRDKKVLSKKGGFLGIGRNNSVNADFDNSQFTKVDIRQLANIPVDAKEVKIVTNHPGNAYKIEKNKNKVSAIQIADANMFWSSSKYLVVVTK